ncbi:hypothetical protein BC830DRAFT_208123 [Chytriomyces sp. MP71]|nr:hypothetical protein BC830DRAFT_208123 [Chytriomyces sp. MP71]
MSAFLMYVSAYWNNPFKISVAWAVQNYILNKTDMKRRISTLLRSKSLLRRSSFHQDDEEPFPPSLNAARNTISFHSSPTRRSVSGYQDHRHSQITANSGIRRTSTFGPGLRMDLNTTTSKVMRAASSSCGSGDMTGSASSSPDFSSDELKARLPKSLVGDFGTLRSVRGSARSGRRVSETIAGPAALNCVKTSVTDDNDSR